MPWPIWDREVQCMATGMFDNERKALLSVCQSIDAGVKVFGMEIPETAEGHVRVDMKKGFHFFQYIDANTTKYMCIYNSDP